MRFTPLIAITITIVGLAACGGSSGAKQCTAGATECITDSIARVCAADGSWAVQECGADSMCMGSGGCALATDISCNEFDSGCVDATHAIVCNSDGKGFQAVTCPTGTTCQGVGNCVGTCTVGSSGCANDQTVITCTDGFNFKQTSCTPGSTTCVATSGPNSRMDTAACMPSQCTPQGVVCGDKAADPASTDPNYASTCESSPTGLHWQSEQCAISTSCVPGFGCLQDCTPGDQRCNGDAIQTCDANGFWGASTACQPTATGVQQVCMYLAGYTAPVCGDAVCAGSTAGTCASDGFHPCTNGKVGAGQECATGICVTQANTCSHPICSQGVPLVQSCGSCAMNLCNYDPYCCDVGFGFWDSICVGEVTSICGDTCPGAEDGTPINGYTPGVCEAQCNPGDTRCDGNEAYQGCDGNHRWSSTITQCPSNGTDQCVEYFDASNGAQKTICGACAPGSHRCTDTGGVVGGANPNTSVETCDSTGHWGSPATCSMGQCQATSRDAACVMQCVPNSTVCMGGGPASPSNPSHPGTVNWGTCDANGNLPTTGGTACGAGTSCRRHSDGQPVGAGPLACVQCVGSDNEVGFVDSLCLTAASPNSVETCAANNTWNTPTVCANTSPYLGVCKFENSQGPAVCE